MSYVDSFVIPVPEKSLTAYKRLARLGCKVWMDHGALHYAECLADDVPAGKRTDFFRSVKLKEGEVLVFAYVVYRNKRHRDAVLKKVMADPRMQKTPPEMPFDGKRMIYGGFRPFVEA